MENFEKQSLELSLVKESYFQNIGNDSCFLKVCSKEDVLEALEKFTQIWILHVCARNRILDHKPSLHANISTNMQSIDVISVDMQSSFSDVLCEVISFFKTNVALPMFGKNSMPYEESTSYLEFKKLVKERVVPSLIKDALGIEHDVQSTINGVQLISLIMQQAQQLSANWHSDYFSVEKVALKIVEQYNDEYHGQHNEEFIEEHDEKYHGQHAKEYSKYYSKFEECHDVQLSSSQSVRKGHITCFHSGTIGLLAAKFATELFMIKYNVQDGVVCTFHLDRLVRVVLPNNQGYGDALIPREDEFKLLESFGVACPHITQTCNGMIEPEIMKYATCRAVYGWIKSVLLFKPLKMPANILHKAEFSVVNLPNVVVWNGVFKQ